MSHLSLRLGRVPEGPPHVTVVDLQGLFQGRVFGINIDLGPVCDEGRINVLEMIEMCVTVGSAVQG